MKTLKGNKVAVIKNGHTAEEMREIEKAFWSLETVKYSIEELVKIESAKKEGLIPTHENLHQNRR